MYGGDGSHLGGGGGHGRQGGGRMYGGGGRMYGGGRSYGGQSGGGQRGYGGGGRMGGGVRMGGMGPGCQQMNVPPQQQQQQPHQQQQPQRAPVRRFTQQRVEGTTFSTAQDAASQVADLYAQEAKLLKSLSGSLQVPDEGTYARWQNTQRSGLVNQALMNLQSVEAAEQYVNAKALADTAQMIQNRNHTPKVSEPCRFYSQTQTCCRSNCPYEHDFKLRETQYQRRREKAISQLMVSLGRGPSTTVVAAPSANASLPDAPPPLPHNCTLSLAAAAAAAAATLPSPADLSRLSSLPAVAPAAAAAPQQTPSSPSVAAVAEAVPLQPQPQPSAAPKQREGVPRPLSAVLAASLGPATPSRGELETEERSYDEADGDDEDEAADEDDCFVVAFAPPPTTPRKEERPDGFPSSVVSVTTPPSKPRHMPASPHLRASKDDLDRQLEEFRKGSCTPGKRDRSGERDDRESRMRKRYE